MKRKKPQDQKQGISSKYLTILFIGLFALVTLQSIASAHSPSTLTATYNLDIQELRITISHQVQDPIIHYIFKVQIKKNGADYNTSVYSSQPDPNSFLYTYKVNATAGDTIEVTASCIQGGTKTTQYIIAQDNTDNTDNDTSTPGFELIILLGAIIAGILIVRKKHT